MQSKTIGPLIREAGTRHEDSEKTQLKKLAGGIFYTCNRLTINAEQQGKEGNNE